MIDTMDIVSNARDCVGVPVHHFGRNYKVGLDCAGVVLHSVRKAGYPMKGFEDPPYRKVPSWMQLVGVCDKYFQEVWNAETSDMSFRFHLKNGDIILLSLRRYPIHMAIAAVDLRGWNIIHALHSNEKVVEHRLDEMWEEKVRRVYRVPGAD